MCGVALIIALTLSDFIVYNIYKNELYMDTYNNAYVDTSNVIKSIDSIISNYGDVRLDDDVLLKFIFERINDEYTLNEYYNCTVFSVEELENYFEKECEIIDIGKYFGDTQNNKTIRQTKFHYGSGEILLHGFEIKDSIFYRVYDIRSVKGKCRTLIYQMFAIASVMILVMFMIIWFLLNKAFSPLHKLSESARAMAEGNYCLTIDAKGDDEIGELAKDFNKMSCAIRENIEEIKKSEHNKTVFMGNLTHELRTPLTAIYGYAQTMKAVKLNKNDMDMALDYIESQCIRLNKLSDKMMTLLRIDSDNELTFRKVSVKEIFDSAIAACHVKINDKQVELRVTHNNDYIFADRELMTDVIINLLDNAIKAIDLKGKVSLYTQRDEDFQIIVEDNGKGIPFEEIDKITEPFYMVDKSRSRKNGGSGLGLAIVTIILKHHDAKLDIHSSVGEGTRMTIHFWERKVE